MMGFKERNKITPSSLNTIRFKHFYQLSSRSFLVCVVLAGYLCGRCSTVNIPDYVCWPILHLVEHLAQDRFRQLLLPWSEYQDKHHNGHYGSEAQQGIVKKQLPKNQIEREGKA